MITSRKLFALLGFAALAALSAPAAHADDFSFTGNFTQDDNVQLFNFSVSAPTTVTLQTLGYAGGVNAAGQDIASGGFDPFVALFDSNGALLDYNDDGAPGDVGTDPATGNAYDSFLQSDLAAGEYTVALTEADNIPNAANDNPLGNISEGFTRDGQGNFTGPVFGPGTGAFYDVSGSQRDSHWALDIIGVDHASAVPEPSQTAAFGLGALGLMGLMAFARKRRAIV